MAGPEDPGRGLDSAHETAAAPEKLRPAADDARFTPGTLLAGRYRIVSPLGKGGMGEVYRADDIRLGQPVALKFLPSAFASDVVRLERLVDEVRIGRQISHPNVCRLYDIAEAEGHHFLVMEYVDGEDLASLLRRIGRLPGDKALEIARGVCAGLAAAHDKGVIHRDLKPANVMIDGHGHARIADFGLAALAASGPAAGYAGTPAYMAPEQLLGEGASLRSDVYALGLVLHEMFTGQRVYEAKSVDELRALHAQMKSPSLTSSAKDVDPGVERVVLRCLERDPKERPADARVVLLSLPGGDPLQAAVLAGETPSPEMVAAAAKVGDLRPVVAWTCLLSGLVGLVLAAILAGRSLLVRQVPGGKPPEVLLERAREVLDRLGYREIPADSARGLAVDRALLDHVRRQHASGDWLHALRTARPGPYLFYYRQSPQKLVSNSWIPAAPWAGPADVGVVTRTDPPLDLPGMREVVLDAYGRLVSFVAVPPRFVAATGADEEPDWQVAIAAAGLDPAALRAATPLWTAPVDTDRKRAWDGVNPDQPGARLHIEAASHRGRPVYFEVQGPWVEPPSTEARRDPAPLIAAMVLNAVLICATVVAGTILIRRNLRLGRGDRRGAFRVGAFAFATILLADLFRADHSLTALPEYNLLIQIFSQALAGALGVWATYVALEPAVRRRWPETLVSWSRLLGGRLRDPLLGRDVLAGLLATLAVVAQTQLTRSAAAWLGLPPPRLRFDPGTLGSPWRMLSQLLEAPVVAVLFSLSALFFLYIFYAATRRTWAARLLLFVVLLTPSLTIGYDLRVALFAGGVVALVWLTVLLRFGLVGSSSFVFTLSVLQQTPLTLDGSAWYAGRSFAVLGFFAALLTFAFYASLGGKPVFGRALLDE